jgi:ribonuclease-3
MKGRQKKLLKEYLLDSKIPFYQKIREFIKIFNTNSPDPSPQSEKWNITSHEWQRYEFLGDRVLNLVVADYLYHHAPANWDGENREGEMTKKMGVVSNESLTEIIERKGFDIDLLIPDAIGRQKAYGERIKGGALEALIGALYEILGFTWTHTFVLTILSGEIEWYDPAKNSIGTLQEWCQKRGKILPTYLETCRTGPDHNPHFSVRVQIADGRTFEGSGPSLPVARQNAAEMALKNI